MSIAPSQPWTAEQFLSWAATQEERYEFDGMGAVAMTWGSGRHNRICQNVYAALRSRLSGKSCDYFGPDLGVRTVGEAVRYPDALITCTKFDETAWLAPHPVVVFEVLSPDSGGRDRLEKVREYAAIASSRRYVMVESEIDALMVLHRLTCTDDWTALALGRNDELDLPEAGISLPVAAVYENVVF